MEVAPILAGIRVPSYRLHKSDSRPVVTLGGRDVFLGKHGTSESRQKYARVIAEWEAAGRQLVTRADDLTILELVAHFWTWAQSYFRRPDGTQTHEVAIYRQALRPLKELYGNQLARDFAPRALKALQVEMVRLGWNRTVINKQVGRIKRVFKWGAGEEMLPASVWHALQAVPGLKRGRTAAPES